MAEGKLGGGISNSSSNGVVVYDAPGDINYATISIHSLNDSNVARDITLYISTSTTPARADKVVIRSIPANGGTFDWDCGILSPGEKVIIVTDNTDIVTRVTGLEKRA